MEVLQIENVNPSMAYQTTITTKGQITIPKAIRDMLGLRPSSRVFVDFDMEKQEASIKASNDFLSVAKSIHVKKPADPLVARERMESVYERE
ncbi:hypothetical protein A3D69_02435 [Candidatus Uhrbacteria bacterium RIFCSPHIGHO2_02_FULL_54_11]|nr:MAG: hypothetical protein A3D69_02435 [Candidatus Uhrbacteria bacterium RIFCSPHIGHO2_02_FULL_54_11]